MPARFDRRHEEDPLAAVAKPLSEIEARSVRWLWEPYLPRGKLVLLDGDPGIGKSLIAIDLAARLSIGKMLPDGTRNDCPQSTLILNAEDDPSDTTRPRAEAAHADLDRLFIVNTRCGSHLTLPYHLKQLWGLVKRYGPDLVILDPFQSMLDARTAASPDRCITEVLEPLAALSETTGATFLLHRHLGKATAGRAIYRGLGSIRMMGTVRTALLAAPHPLDPELCVLALSKSNLTSSAPSLAYRVVKNGLGKAEVEWRGRVDLPADALWLPDEHLLPREQAAAWLREQLASGPRKASDLLAAAAAAGIPEVTLKRARHQLQFQTRRVSRPDLEGWYWYNPAGPWPEDSPISKPSDLSWLKKALGGAP